MAFFDDLGKRLSDAGQSAVQKTRGLADIVRLNENIAAEERKRNDGYSQIGKLYMTLHASDYEPDFEMMVLSIRQSEKRIAEYRQQIKEMKGVGHCENCGAEVAKGAAFCTVCGAPVLKRDAVANVGMNQCPHCGQMVDKGMQFCIFCGHPITVTPPGEEQELFRKRDSIPQQERADFTEEKPESQNKTKGSSCSIEPSMKTCPQCGTKLLEELDFCTECGMKLP